MSLGRPQCLLEQRSPESILANAETPTRNLPLGESCIVAIAKMTKCVFGPSRRASTYNVAVIVCLLWVESPSPVLTGQLNATEALSTLEHPTTPTNKRGEERAITFTDDHAMCESLVCLKQDEATCVIRDRFVHLNFYFARCSSPYMPVGFQFVESLIICNTTELPTNSCTLAYSLALAQLQFPDNTYRTRLTTGLFCVLFFMVMSAVFFFMCCWVNAIEPPGPSVFTPYSSFSRSGPFNIPRHSPAYGCANQGRCIAHPGSPSSDFPDSLQSPAGTKSLPTFSEFGSIRNIPQPKTVPDVVGVKNVRNLDEAKPVKNAGEGKTIPSVTEARPTEAAQPRDTSDQSQSVKKTTEETPRLSV